MPARVGVYAILNTSLYASSSSSGASPSGSCGNGMNISESRASSRSVETCARTPIFAPVARWLRARDCPSAERGAPWAFPVPVAGAVSLARQHQSAVRKQIAALEPCPCPCALRPQDGNPSAGSTPERQADTPCRNRRHTARRFAPGILPTSRHRGRSRGQRRGLTYCPKRSRSQGAVFRV